MQIAQNDKPSKKFADKRGFIDDIRKKSIAIYAKQIFHTQASLKTNSVLLSLLVIIYLLSTPIRLFRYNKALRTSNTPRMVGSIRT